jgi:VanZ family protein
MSMVALRRILIVLTALYWAALLTATHLPKPPNLAMAVSDKVEHFLAYGVLMGLLYLAFWVFRPRQWWMAWVALAVVLAYGALDEWTQPWTGRDCDFRDWLADTGGAVLALGLLTGIRWLVERRQRLHTGMPAYGGETGA